MSKLARVYDSCFWLAFAVGLTVAALGCGTLNDAVTAVTTPTETGTVPLSDAVSAVPELIANPADPVAWGKIVTVAVIFFGGLFGVYKVRQARAK